MKKNPLIIVSLLLFSSLNCLAEDKQLPELLSIEPDTVKMRHAQDIKIILKHWQPGTQLSVTPGGAYIKTAIPIQSNKNIHTNSGNTWITLEKEIHIYNKSLELAQRIQLQENLTQIAFFNRTLLTLADNKLQFFKTDDSLSLNEVFNQRYKKTVLKASLTDGFACLLLQGNQLLQLDLNSQSSIFSSPQTKTITNIDATNNNCISIADNKTITLWQNINNKLQAVSTFHSNSAIHESVVNNNHIMLANANNGLTILNANNNELQWLGSYNKLGNIIQIAYQNNQVLVADDKGVLSLFDISRVENPLLISDFHLQQNISDLTFDDDIAYAITNNKLFQIDLSAKSTPTISTLGVNQGGSRRSFIKENIIYVADWFSGMHMYDISIPRSPRLLSSFHTPGSPKGVVVRNNTAFVADDDHGLQIIDVSDPFNPVFLADLPLTGLAYTMKLINNLLYIASHRGGFHIVDVSDEKQPKLVSTYDTPGKAWALEYQAGYLYVADDNSGLMIFDVKNPSNPELVNQFNPGGFAEDVILKNNKAYIAFFDLGLIVLDISNPLELKILSQLQTPGNARGIEIKNNLLYLASWEAGVLIIDISDATNPNILGQYDTKGATWGLSVKDHIIYAMDWWGGVKVIDAHDPQHPTFLGKYQTAGKINDILYHDKFIYTAHGSRGLQVYDANNSLNPVWATGLDFDGDAKSIALNKNLGLVAAGDSGLVLVDISNPFQIKWLSQINTPTSADMIASFDNFAFVATKNGDLFVIDISNSKRPQLIKRHTANTQSIKASENTLWQLNEKSTISKFYVNSLTKKLTSDQYFIESQGNILGINKHELFLANNNGEINRYQINKDQLQKTASIKLNEQFIDLHLQRDKLFSTAKSNKLYVFNIQNPESIQLQTIYPTTHEIKTISTSNDGVFLSGESAIASGKLLPDINILHNKGEYLAKVPKIMPLGAYNLNISAPNGQQKTISNAFQIAFPKFKSKFTMEDLKRKMQQQNLSGKANSDL